MRKNNQSCHDLQAAENPKCLCSFYALNIAKSDMLYSISACEFRKLCNFAIG